MVFFYAKYDYETPGLSGGGVWAYGAKGNTQKTSSSSEYWDSTIRPKRKAAIRNDGASNADQAHAKPRNAANPTTSKKPFTGFATSTVSQEEAQGHIASLHFDEKVHGLDTRLGNIQQMLLGNFGFQKDLRDYLKTSTEAQTRLEATLGLGDQNTKLIDSLNFAKDENVDLKLRVKDSEREFLIKCNSLKQDHHKEVLKYEDQRRRLERAYEERLEAAKTNHDKTVKDAETQLKNDAADMQRRYDDLMRENASALEKKSELAQQLQGELDALTTKLQREHEKEMSNYEKDIQKLQDEVISHKSDKTQLIQQYGEQVEALRATEELLRKIDSQQPRKEDLERRHGEQLESLLTIERHMQDMEAQQLDKEYVTQRYDEQSESLQKIERRLEQIDARQLDKESAVAKYEEQAKSLGIIEKRLQEIDIRQQNRENDTTIYEEQVKSFQEIDKRLEEISARQLDKDNATEKYREQLGWLHTIGQRLDEMNARQVDKGDEIARYEEQAISLDGIRTRLEAMDSRLLTENAPARYHEQSTSLNAITKRLEDMDARQLDKEHAAQRHEEEIQLLGKLETLLKDINSQENLARRQKEQAEAFATIEALIMNLEEHQPDKEFLEMKHLEQVQELRMVKELVQVLDAKQPHHEKLAQDHQEHMKALDAIEELVKSISSHNFAQRHEEQIKTLIAIEDLLKEASAQQPGREELIEKHEEQLQKITSLENDLKEQLGKVVNAIDRVGSEQNGKEHLEQRHREILQALESSRQVGPDDGLKSQLVAIQQILEKIEGQQQDIRSAVPEQLPQVLDENNHLIALTAENAGLLSSIQMEKEGFQKQHQEMSSRFEETAKALELVKSELQEARSGQESLEIFQESWVHEKDILEKKLASIITESVKAQAEAETLQQEKETLQNEKESMRLELESVRTDFDNQLKHYSLKADEEEYRRRKLFEQVQALRGNIRVMCRIRPPAPETDQELLLDFHPTKGEFVDHYQKIEVVTERESVLGTLRQTSKFLECERIFTPEHSNNDIFEEISQLTMSALDGKKVCIFCYGQTGSGKTYTMNHRVGPTGHDDPNDGIIHRSLALMFEQINSHKDQYKYNMKISIVEVYINDLIDLLSTRKRPIVKSIEDATDKDMTSREAVDELIEDALNNRVVGATNANANSSRSHLILCFKIERKVLKGRDAGIVQTGILNLIDLAGSEKNRDAGSDVQRMEESRAINTSIFELNQSITGLAEGKPKRPNHTLTRVLDPCLAKGCRVIMFVMVSPLKKDQAETENTMAKAELAAKAKLNSKASNSPTSPGGRRSSIPVLKKDPVAAKKEASKKEASKKEASKKEASKNPKKGDR